MSYYGGTITVQGRNLITGLLAGETITLTRVVVGAGAMPEGVEPIDMTELVQPVAEASTSVPEVDNGVLYLTVEYRNDMNGGLEEGFWLREFGIFAKTDQTEEILLYYATLGDSPQPVNAYRDNRIDIRRYPVSIQLELEAGVEVDYRPGSFVTSEEAHQMARNVAQEVAKSKADQVPEFEEAETLGNIQSGDSMPGILGKLKKWYTSLHRVAWSGKYGDLKEVPTVFPPASHNHDDRYFTETEITTKLAEKSNTDHTHTAAQVGAAASNHTHNYAGSQTSGGAAENALKLGGILAEKYATISWVNQLQSQYLNIEVSDTGDDATADGTANKPFKTIGAALKKYPHPKIAFTCDTSYTVSESVVIANRSVLFLNGTWHMKDYIYLYNSMLGWQNCTVNWYQGYNHIRAQGVCSFIFGDYWDVTFSALSQSGGTATGYVTVITSNNTDMNDKVKCQSPFMAATSYRLTLGEKLRLFSSGFGAAIVLWRPVQTTISDGSYLYNNSNNAVATEQIGTSGVYVLK